MHSHDFRDNKREEVKIGTRDGYNRGGRSEQFEKKYRFKDDIPQTSVRGHSSA